MVQTRAGRVKRIVFTIFKVLFALGFTLALLVALAYKKVIPGGEWMIDTAEATRTGFRRFMYEREAASVPAGSVVFLGSSSMAAFPFALYYPGKPWLNRGLPTETALQLGERLVATMPVAKPSGIVLWTGMNDLRSDGQPPPVVVERVVRILDMLKEGWPDVPVAVVEIPPQCDSQQDFQELVRWVNRRVEEAAKARGMAFVRTDRPPLSTPVGQLEPGAAMLDRRHLNLVGNGLLAQWILEDGGAATAALRPE